MPLIQTLFAALKFKWNRFLNTTIYRAQIERDFTKALWEVRAAYTHIPEDEINADIELALAEVRAENAMRQSQANQ